MRVEYREYDHERPWHPMTRHSSYACQGKVLERILQGWDIDKKNKNFEQSLLTTLVCLVWRRACPGRILTRPPIADGGERAHRGLGSNPPDILDSVFLEVAEIDFSAFTRT